MQLSGHLPASGLISKVPALDTSWEEVCACIDNNVKTKLLKERLVSQLTWLPIDIDSAKNIEVAEDSSMAITGQYFVFLWLGNNGRNTLRNFVEGRYGGRLTELEGMDLSRLRIDDRYRNISYYIKPDLSGLQAIKDGLLAIIDDLNQAVAERNEQAIEMVDEHVDQLIVQCEAQIQRDKELQKDTGVQIRRNTIKKVQG